MILTTLSASMAMAASTGIGIIFVTTAISKFRHRDILPGVVANYRLLNPRLEQPVATMLPIVEFATGLALMANFSGHAPVVAIFLLGLFAVAMAINILRGRSHIDCGCGRSQLRQPLSWLLVGRNVLLALLLIPAVAPSQPMSLPPAAIGLALAAGITLALFYFVFNALAALNANASRVFGS